MKKGTTHESERREYRSALRAEQAEATRQRILEATWTRIQEGDRELGYTAIARTARVAVPTVYRHFPTRQDLFVALSELAERGQPPVTAPRDEAELLALIRGFFRRFDDEDGVYARATRLNAVWEMSRATSVPRRRAMAEAYVDERLAGLPDHERRVVIDLFVVLVSSGMSEALRGYLDVSGDGAGERVAYALEALFAFARSHIPPESP